MVLLKARSTQDKVYSKRGPTLKAWAYSRQGLLKTWSTQDYIYKHAKHIRYTKHNNNPHTQYPYNHIQRIDNQQLEMYNL